MRVYRFSIFNCKEYTQSAFGIDLLMISMDRVILVLCEKVVCYDHCVLLTKLSYLCPTSFGTSRANVPVNLGISSYFCILIPCV